jgi:Zn-dependent protease
MPDAGVIDAGACPLEPTTVIDLTPMGNGGDPEVLRHGRGERRPAGPVSRPTPAAASETIRAWTIANLIQTVLIYALPVLFAITVHEAAHGYAARHFGDNTAYMLGRITLNPVKHIDPVGTILMPLLLYFATSGAFLFGYAKPVPVNFGNLRNPKRDMVWVALAGPASNLVQALVLWARCWSCWWRRRDEPFFLKMAQAGVLVNLVMWAFNLFPLPPLDGGRILVGLLPWKQAHMRCRASSPGAFSSSWAGGGGRGGHLWLRPLMAWATAPSTCCSRPLQRLR